VKPTDKQKKIILVVVGVFAASYLFRYLVNFAAQMAYYQKQAAQQAQDAQEKKAVPCAGSGRSGGPCIPKNPQAGDSDIDPATFSKLAGVWGAKGELKGRGFCDLRFELTEIATGEFSGFSRFSCSDIGGYLKDKSPNVLSLVREHTSPDAAILTGTVDKGSIRFRATKSIGTDISGCSVTAFTITPFGSNGVLSEWQEGNCPGGSMLLERQKS